MRLQEFATLVTLASLLTGSGQLAHAQSGRPGARGPRDCVIRKEPDGLIRGDRIPKGCVLTREEDVQREEEARPAVVCEETIVHTPNAKKTVLANCAGLSRGRMVISAVPPASGAVGQRHFGPIQRHFGPLQRRFGPVQRHFGPLQRRFQPLQRNFGSAPRSGGGGP